MIEEPTPEFMALSGVAQEECPLMPGEFEWCSKRATW
jgi:hypothetical protein